MNDGWRGRCCFVQYMHTTLADHPVMSTAARRTLTGAVASLFHLILSFVRQRACALRGHNLMMAFAPKRLSLHCAACGFDTPGWELDLKMRSASRQPRIRVIARTAPAVAKTMQLPAASHAAHHAHAA